MSGEALVVKGLHTYYRTRLKENIYAVSGISLSLKAGKVLGIAGESGCGKSTLALSLMGFYFPPLYYKQGAIYIGKKDIMQLEYEELRKNYLSREIAYIPQAAMNVLNPTRKIKNFIKDAVKIHKPNLSDDDIIDLAKRRFEALALPTRVLDSFPCELSGGMKQRTVIVISTLLNPGVLIADEPSSALDVTSQKSVIRLLRDLMKMGFVKSMIFITHELPLLYHVADEITIMYAGQFVEQGSSHDIVFNALHPYAQALMDSIIVPEDGLKSHKLAAIPGSPPNLKQVLKGCRFAERCKYAEEKCRTKDIDVLMVGKRMYRCWRTVEELQSLYKQGVYV